MEFIKNFDTLISNIRRRDYSQCIAMRLGQYADLYDTVVRNAMFLPEKSNQFDLEKTIDFYGIRKKYIPNSRKDLGGVAVSYDLDPTKTHAYDWCNNKCMQVYTTNPRVGSPEFLLMNFREYLNNFKIVSYHDVLDMYNSISDFYYDYSTAVNIFYDIEEKKEDLKNICDFLVSNILTKINDAGSVLYMIWLEPEEKNIYSDVFNSISRLIKLSKTASRTNVNEFVLQLYNFYDKYCLYKERLNCDKKTDILLAYYIIRSGNSELTKDLLTKLEYCKLGKFFESSLEITGEPYYTKTEDVSVVVNDMYGASIDDITFFGNTEIIDELSANGVEALKRDLCKFTPDMVKNYFDISREDKVIFDIDEQLKMYLKAELNCKMLIVNICRNSYVTMLTVLNYENDNFVLFKLSDDNNTLYGLSINENLETKERKLISIDRDDDLSFQFVVNFNEEE